MIWQRNELTWENQDELHKTILKCIYLFVLIILNFMNFDNSGIWGYTFPNNLRTFLMQRTFERVVQTPSNPLLQRRKPERWQSLLKGAQLCWEWQSRDQHPSQLTLKNDAFEMKWRRESSYFHYTDFHPCSQQIFSAHTICVCAGTGLRARERQGLYLHEVTFRSRRLPWSAVEQ